MTNLITTQSLEGKALITTTDQNITQKTETCLTLQNEPKPSLSKELMLDDSDLESSKRILAKKPKPPYEVTNAPNVGSRKNFISRFLASNKTLSNRAATSTLNRTLMLNKDMDEVTKFKTWMLLKQRKPEYQEYFNDQAGKILLKEIPSIAILINSIVKTNSDIEMEFLIKLLKQIIVVIGRGAYSLELSKFYSENCLVPIDTSDFNNMTPTKKVIADIQKFFPPEVSESTTNLEYEIICLDTTPSTKIL